ncbi:DNA-entry nuclease [Lactobacillus kefiranofaciens]|uniref:DNA/RNA non-specific endonuclease n=1 Tax=Lactobacillus kefiranofaciens TaxID=267818 RepID=UPI000BA6CA9E|nr:DNA/RNA non-specific endonuclease [Lactobacillus kefiranofaciens]MCP9331677.1 DNA/RNA non-specific endonuclease [Lactobacillus kefiranofaciens]PAK97562.1 DNA-entry nuclease [Lactobacillus kefiranofaciens]
MKKHRLTQLLTTALASVSLFALGANAKPAHTTVQAVSAKSLTHLNYKDKSIVTVSGNKPSFSKSTKSKARGPWQKYSNLDYLNRAHAANALLNKKLMPRAEREPLYVDPTGWHNKRIAGGWLYNRCHLIGYQLTGQNNNLKNLITGTRQLNDPDMLKYEDKVADYIKASGKHYIRYRVTPIWRGNELLARGVQMEAQSIGDNSVHFNVFIFNVQPGVKLNYKNGRSQVTKSSTVKKAKKASKKHYVAATTKRRKTTRVKKRRVIHHKKGTISTAKYRVVGNKRSKIYHFVNGQNYHMSSANAIYFKSEAAARAAGYRKSMR